MRIAGSYARNDPWSRPAPAHAQTRTPGRRIIGTTLAQGEDASGLRRHAPIPVQASADARISGGWGQGPFGGLAGGRIHTLRMRAGRPSVQAGRPRHHSSAGPAPQQTADFLRQRPVADVPTWAVAVAWKAP